MAFDLKSARHWAEELLRQAAGPGAVGARLSLAPTGPARPDHPRWAGASICSTLG